MVVVLVIAVVNRFVVGLILLNDAWLYTRRRGKRRGADGITENRQK
jgi:hypothetical protein